MKTEQKNQLAMRGISTKDAAAIRVKAARLSIKMTQKELGEKIHRQMAQICNIEKGLSYPPWTLMVYLYEEHRIDINFIVSGSYSTLPADVQEQLFSTLSGLQPKAV